jgi:hypothetical protein
VKFKNEEEKQQWLAIVRDVAAARSRPTTSQSGVRGCGVAGHAIDEAIEIADAAIRALRSRQ